jgi:acrylyl-CoA reductase (NADPH)
MSVALLAARGYRAVAATGSADAHDYLRSLGATRIVGRKTLSEAPRLPLASTQWAGAIDSVGGDTLANIIAATKRHGAVASCGLAGGSHLHTTVFPLILRGVALLGIDSNTCPQDRRQRAWNRLAADLDAEALDAMTETIALTEVPDYSERITRGKTQGRIVVDVQEA